MTQVREAVASSSALPPTGNMAGDVRLTEDTGHLWLWDGTAWVDAGPAGVPGQDGTDGTDAQVTDANVAAALSDDSRAVVEPWIDGRTGTGKRPVGRDEVTVNVLDHGCSEASTDNTAALQAVLDTYRDVFVPQGVSLAVAGTVEMHGTTRLRLAAGAELYRPAAASSTGPVVHMRSTDAVLEGAGMRASYIRTEKPSPIGVVCIGHLGVTDTVARAASYNTVRSIGMMGYQEGGETSGAPSVGLLLCNLQINGLPSYFATVADVYVEKVNIGIDMVAWANAHIIRNIQFQHVGNNKGGAAIRMAEHDGKAPLDNTISQIFHHFSPGADTIRMEGEVIYNNLTDIMAEPGGTLPRFLVNTVPGCIGNNITGLDNVMGGNSLTDDFLANNSVVTRAHAWFGNLDVSRGRQGGLWLTELDEYTKYRAIDVHPTGLVTLIVRVDVAIYSTQNDVSTYRGSSSVTCEIQRSTWEGVTVKVVDSWATQEVLLAPIVSDTTVQFGLSTGTNNQSTTHNYAKVMYSISDMSRCNVVEYTNPTTATAGDRMPRHGGRIGNIYLRDNDGTLEKSTNGTTWTAV